MWGLVWPLLRSWLLRRGLSLLGWLAAAAAVLAVLLGTRHAGRQAERVEQLRRYLEVRDRQLRALRTRPHDRADLGRLMRRAEF